MTESLRGKPLLEVIGSNARAIKALEKANDFLESEPLSKKALKIIDSNVETGEALAESILSNPDIATGLNRDIGGGDKDAILGSIVSQLQIHPENQEPFINSLFDELTKEGKWVQVKEGKEVQVRGGEWIQTNRRDAAFTILADEAMKPIIEDNLDIVADVYLNAINLQTAENDPFSGSIDILIETGKAILPYFPQDLNFNRKVVATWKKMIKRIPEGFPFGSDKAYLQSRLKEIKYAMSHHWALDNKVEELKLKKPGLMTGEIVEQLDSTEGMITQAIQRLRDQDRI